jgi:hypothetical protein
MHTKELNLEFGQVYVLDNILITELKEGLLFNAEKNQKLIELAQDIFQGKPYGYISNRKNSYAVDPLIYRDSAKVGSLKAIAIVTDSEIVKLNVNQVERKFYRSSNSFEVFDILEQAINWIKFKI